ncbi:type II toxin-antitoxin system RelE/ParE family toxin [Nocardia testacea]|uniref:type II toxin-antitoxin system RelE/ParE family toxin n=1 Tax=Nocardia testacea TaxID=248551 RepID=UPI003C2DB4F8
MVAHEQDSKELRPMQTMIRVLFAFDPWRSAILRTGCDKSGQWEIWYEQAIPNAEELYAVYLKERAEEEEER